MKFIEIRTPATNSTYLVNVEHIVKVLIVTSEGKTDLSIYLIDGSDYQIAPDEAEKLERYFRDTFLVKG